MQAGEFEEAAVDRALALRVEAAEALRLAIRGALERTHAMLEPEQRKRLAYLLRSGVISI